MAMAAGVSPLVVGLTVVAFGTSTPELAITVGAAYSGEAALALGNVIGSSIFNVLFVLGATAIVAPITVSVQLVRLDVPLMIGASLLTAGMSLDGRIDRVDGALLFACIIGYTAFQIRQSRAESADVREQFGEMLDSRGARKSRIVANLLLMAGGIALLVLGTRWLVSGAVGIAETLGVSEVVIGLTIVAAGTSLPEVATSIVAGLRGARDIAVGNIVGSNLFNLLAVLGLGSLVAPDVIPVPPGVLTFDIPVMVAAAIGVLPLCFTGYAIARWEGLVLFGYYIAYTAYLVLQAVEHPWLNDFRVAMLYFVFPLTAVSILVTLQSAYARRRHA